MSPNHMKPLTRPGSLQARWSQLAPREQRLLRAATVGVLGALLWQLCLAPSLATLRTAEPQARALGAQLQQMLALQAQARELQKQAAPAQADALRALQLATQQTLGNTAQLSVNGDRVSLTLQAASADALAQWLAQARQNARAVPTEARLTRTRPPANAMANTQAPATWNGVLVLALPPR